MSHAPSTRRGSAPTRPLSTLLALTLSALLAASGALPRASSASASAAVAPAAAATAAASCPVEPPMPLRMLFRVSERIVVARAGEPAGYAGAENENQRRTAFDVTESLKGDPGEKRLQVYHWMAPGYPDFSGNFRAGETVLLFLRPAADVEEYGYEVVDIRYGAKRLAEDDLKVYLKRIEELGWLTRQEPPAHDELAEWLVRCAEEPATRWEGAYELDVSRRVAAAQDEARRRAAGEKIGGEGEGEESTEDEEAAGEKSEASDDAGEEGEGEEAGADPDAEASGEQQPADGAEGVEASAAAEEEPGVVVYGSDPAAEMRLFMGSDVDAAVFAALTPEQKERLASALYGAEKLGAGEVELVPVVETWDDGRLAPYLIKHLSKLTDDPPYEAEALMQTVASLLKDKRLKKLAEEYSENAPYGEYVEDEEESAESEGGEDGDGEGGGSSVVQAVASGEVKTRTPTAQVRGTMLRAFLAAVEERLNRMSAETAQR